MNIFDWYTSKRDSLLNELSTKKNTLLSEWNDFLEKDTYLTFDLKEKFLEDYSKFFHWIFLLSKKVRISSREYSSLLEKLKLDVNNYNPVFIEKRLKDYKSFFDGKDDKLKIGLDTDQRLAVVVDDKHNMVIAGAGSGKTEVISSKIAYLVRRKDKIAPEKILALAFNKDAVANMESRLRDNYGIDNVNVMTFHKLGRNIIHEKNKESPKLFENGEDWKIRVKIGELVEKLLKNKEYQDLFLDYLASHLEEEEVEFDKKEEYYEYMQNKRYTTLKNEKVKSISERDIANFLFKYGIDYKYEPLVDWIKTGSDDVEYRPDFYLPAPFNLYIENWGMDKNMKVPEWFSQSSEKYNKIREWKLKQFKDNNKILIQTWDYERNEGVLISNLLKELNKYSKEPLKQRTYQEIVEKTFLFKENKSEIINMIHSFIVLSKANSIGVKDIIKRINSSEYKERQVLFAKIAVEALKEYQSFLKETKQIDFNDMILEAVDIVKNNPSMFKGRYDYILVDEFQDISKPRLDLIKALVDCNNAKLFVVGDDWQSINGFAGAEVSYFVNFSETFEKPAITPLKINYRSSKYIVDMSNKLISNNKNKIDKIILSSQDNGVGVKARVIVLPKGYEENQELRIIRLVDLLKELFAKGVKPAEILILSRFNRILTSLEEYFRKNNMPVNEERGAKNGINFLSVHKSKGLQANHVILLDVLSGTYGFPSEIRDSSVLQIAKNKHEKDPFEEERRLFYVALTRSKEFLYIFTIKDIKSIFLKEIEDFVEEKNIPKDKTLKYNK